MREFRDFPARLPGTLPRSRRLELTVTAGADPDGAPVEIDIRADKRLRESAGARGAIAPMVEALTASDGDLATTRPVCDWIQ